MRAQAALEYIITYGWAIMLVLIILGAGFYFGLIGRASFEQERCDFGPQIECGDFNLGKEGTMAIRIHNNLLDTLNITDISLSEPDEFITLDPDKYLGVLIKTGRDKIIILNCTDTELDPGEMMELDLTITYQRGIPNAPSHFIKGRVLSRVCEGDLVELPDSSYIEGC